MIKYFNILFVYLILLPVTFAAEGKWPDKITLGMSTVLTGPAMHLGQNMLLGVEAGFDRVNRRGGINGSQIVVIAIDDGYEPRLTAPNMHQLIDNPGVVAIIGNVGTPTAIAAVPLANKGKTLLFAPFTGAGVLRKTPPDRYVINYRASYAEETAAMVDALINIGGLSTDEIAFFTQRDGYGDAGYIGGINALNRHGLKNEAHVIHVRYERNTLAVENAVADILFASKSPRAIIMVGAYAPCAKFIKLAQASGLKSLFLNVSFVGSAPLARDLGNNYQDIIVTQVVPHPKDNSIPIVSEYQTDLKAYNKNKEPTFGSLEGYIAARIFIEALKSHKQPPTRESIIDAMENFKELDIGLPQKLYLDKSHHQAGDSVWPTRLQNGQFVPFEWANIVTLLK